MTLYRTYRPQQFSDLVGQDHIRLTLQSALAQGRLSHAYLFAGPRGTGKTTVARLLAKAINCENMELGIRNNELGKNSKETMVALSEPCNACSICLEITDGRSLDVMEVDAASNRGIDEMRELRDKVRFAPSRARKKVYIIDEVHMLTKEAFNALLKTLEEPPAHAIFILATTELHKVPVTISSRCQTFQFKKARQEDLIGRLAAVAESENLKIDDAGLTFLARLAGGSYRDALSLLDQISSHQQTETIDLATIQDVLGLASEERLLAVLEAVVTNDREQTLKLLESLEIDGLDPEQFANQLIEAGRTLLHLSLGAPEVTSETDQTRWQKVADELTTIEIISLIERVVASRQLMKQSIVPILPLEVALVMTIEGRRGELGIRNQELGDEGGDKQIPNLQKGDGGEKGNMAISDQKLAISEEEDDNRSTQPPVVTEEITSQPKENETSPDSENMSDDREATASEPKSSIINNQSSNTGQKTPSEIPLQPHQEMWSSLLDRIRDQNMSVHGLLAQAEFGGIEGDRLIVRVPYKFAADRLADRKHRTLVEQVAGEIHGQALVLHCEVCVTTDHIDHSPNEVTVSPELIDAATEVFGLEEIAG